MPVPMRVVGQVVEGARGETALFKERTRAEQYALERAGHGTCTVECMVTERDALRYALAWLREHLPYGLEALADNWSNNADDF